MPLPFPDALQAGTVFAHRGNRVAERENTLAAFRSAAAAGAAGVELDVRRTADDQLAVHHDAVVDGVGAVCELTMTQLRSAAPWVPTVTEALAACVDLWVNIEIKNDPDDIDWDPGRSAVALLTSIIDPTGVVISSFDWETVAVTSALGWTSGYLVGDGVEQAIERAATAGMRAINPRADLVDDAAVAAAHDRGLWVMAWTVNDIEQGRRLRDAGVDVIFTDDPARMVAAL